MIVRAFKHVIDIQLGNILMAHQVMEDFRKIAGTYILYSNSSRYILSIKIKSVICQPANSP